MDLYQTSILKIKFESVQKKITTNYYYELENRGFAGLTFSSIGIFYQISRFLEILNWSSTLKITGNEDQSLGNVVEVMLDWWNKWLLNDDSQIPNPPEHASTTSTKLKIFTLFKARLPITFQHEIPFNENLFLQSWFHISLEPPLINCKGLISSWKVSEIKMCHSWLLIAFLEEVI